MIKKYIVVVCYSGFPLQNSGDHTHTHTHDLHVTRSERYKDHLEKNMIFVLHHRKSILTCVKIKVQKYMKSSKRFK